ncbi:MAG: branched-chain amino acid ABC transporter permease [Actinomycetota bacterium]
MAVATRASAARSRVPLDAAGIMARAGVAFLIVIVVFVLPLATGTKWDGYMARMAIWAIIGLSVNIITGYAGQLSLGHQAFVGIGAFTSAYVIAHNIGPFPVGIVAAGASGAVMASALGLVSLRIRGLYFALVTLAFGLMTQDTIFNFRSFTGGGAGASAPRPGWFQSDQAYAYLCLLILAVVLFIDWRMSATKPGRAIVMVRNNELGATSLGVNATAYKLVAFAVGGFLAGVGGGLFAHFIGQAYSNDYAFLSPTASPLIFLLMAVVGGLGSRAGIVLASAFFAVFPLVVPPNNVDVPSWLQFIGIKQVLLPTLSPLIGALLLILTVTLYPGGLGQQLLPIRRWLAGGPFIERAPKHAPVDESLEAGAVLTEPAEHEQRADEVAPSGSPGVAGRLRSRFSRRGTSADGEDS